MKPNLKVFDHQPSYALPDTSQKLYLADFNPPLTPDRQPPKLKTPFLSVPAFRGPLAQPQSFVAPSLKRGLIPKSRLEWSMSLGPTTEWPSPMTPFAFIRR